MRHYPALVRKESDSDFSVDFPDFPGCITAGDTLAEAIELAGEALRFHVAGMLEDGDPLPDPTPLELILHSAEARDAAAFLVALRPSKGQQVRINISVDEYLLREIDATAAARGTTRSAFLAETARREMDAELAKEMQVTVASGDRAINAIKRLSARAEKARTRENIPPDLSEIGQPEPGTPRPAWRNLHRARNLGGKN